MIPKTRRMLVLTYLAIIMVISLAFSGALYEVSSHTVGYGLRHQEQTFVIQGGELVFLPPEQRSRIRDAEYRAVRRNLILRLVLLNVVMLGVGILLSDYLARRTLTPLEEALEAQARFTSDAAHELRTPLTAMKTEIEVGLRAPHLSSRDAKELLASNLEEVNKLDNLTSALLRLAKLEASKETWESVRLSTLLRDVVKRVAPLADQKHISFTLPKTKHKVVGDKHQLTELFYVLCENAVKYGVENTVVTVQSSKQNHTVRVSIADHGIGIASADLPHIFERFYRADQSRSKDQTDGYGLGLALARQIASVHSGTITVKSTPGTGSTFTVSLPAGEA